MSKSLQRLVLTGALGFALAGPAFAHAELVSSKPASGASGASPSELDLKFSEGLNLAFTGVKLTGPDKAAVETGKAMLMDGDTTLMVPVTGPLAAGKYLVEWHALSEDGHKTKGSFTFTVAQ